jgi:hypothetical protein
VNGQAQILDAIRGNADLNLDGNTNLDDYSLFQQKLESQKTANEPGL